MENNFKDLLINILDEQNIDKELLTEKIQKLWQMLPEDKLNNKKEIYNILKELFQTKVKDKKAFLEKINAILNAVPKDELENKGEFIIAIQEALKDLASEY